ncbi:MAG TPA: hypothetical protein VKZ79_01190 [Alphaproteobacteria bacterium]|nr:hypothetical protein [Alphaproteobacteria bacterium]
MTVTRRRWRLEPRRTVLLVLLVLVSINALVILSLGLTKPVLEAHAFRQSQTALTIYWLLHGGPLLAYETPNLGYPWSLPLEFPTYQWLVALLSSAGVSIDAAGRLVAFAFYLGCLWPLRVLLRTERFDTNAYLIIATLFLGSPFYLYWSRTVLIESCAVFFDLLWLALFATVARSEKPSFPRVLAMIAVGSVGALTKVTSFPGFMIIAGIIFLAAARRADSLRSRLPTLSALVAGTLLPIIATAIWVAYSDRLKAMNPFGAMLISTQLTGWNFGTLAQRLSSNFWLGVVADRTPAEALGYARWLGLAAIVGTLMERRYLLPAAICVAAFLTPLLVFTNLQIVHDYYQYAAGLFLIGAVGVGIVSIGSWGRGWISVVALVVILAGDVAKFQRYYMHFLVADDRQDERYRLAALVRSVTAPGQSVILIGFGWSPEVPYYGQRKSLQLPYTTDAALMQRVFDDPQRFLGSDTLGAIVFCDDKIKYYDDRAALVRNFLAGRKVLGALADCQVLSANRSAS